MKRQPLYASIVICLTLLSTLGLYLSIDYAHQLKLKVFPDVRILKTRYPVAVEKRGRQNVYRFQNARPAHWRTLAEISESAINAVLASEDGGFWAHKGYEPESIRKAYEDNLKAGKFVRGGSTITQQVVKNLFLSPEKTLSRKARELVLAVEMERSLGKRKILETYLNIAEWGPGIYGIEKASRTYFGKSAGELGAREGAMLAYMLPNPAKLRYRMAGSSRVSNILYKLWLTGKISDEEYSSSEEGSALPSNL